MSGINILPNFDDMQDSMQTVGANLGLLRNLPQVDVQRQLNGLQQSVNKMETALGEVNTKLDNAIGNINTKLDNAIGDINTKLDTAINNLTNLVTANSQRVDNAITNLTNLVNANSQRLDKVDTTLTNMMNVMTTGFSRIDTRLEVLETNSSARALNGHVRSQTEALSPLVSQQNRPILSFPKTLGDLHRMENRGPDITSLLQEIGVSPNNIPHVVTQRYKLLLFKLGIPS